MEEAAVCAVPDGERLAQAGIDLPIDAKQVALLEALGTDGARFAFVVPRVKFKVLWERRMSLE